MCDRLYMIDLWQFFLFFDVVVKTTVRLNDADLLRMLLEFHVFVRMVDKILVINLHLHPFK